MPENEREAYHELCAYTLTHGDATFIHQHVVDAFAAQHATESSKPIGLAFALIGLYLHLEKGLTGRQVQRVHMELARQKRNWPRFSLPAERGVISALDVLRQPEGPGRDQAIHEWCEAVWRAFSDSRPQVMTLLDEGRK